MTELAWQPSGCSTLARGLTNQGRQTFAAARGAKTAISESRSIDPFPDSAPETCGSRRGCGWLWTCGVPTARGSVWKPGSPESVVLAPRGRVHRPGTLLSLFAIVHDLAAWKHVHPPPTRGAKQRTTRHFAPQATYSKVSVAYARHALMVTVLRRSLKLDYWR